MTQLIRVQIFMIYLMISNLFLGHFVYSKLQSDREEPDIYSLSEDERNKVEISIEDLFEKEFKDYNISHVEGKGILIEKDQAKFNNILKSESMIWHFKKQFQSRIFGLLEKKEKMNSQYEYEKSQQPPLEKNEEELLDLLYKRKHWMLLLSPNKIWILSLKGRFISNINESLSYSIKIDFELEPDILEKQKSAYLTSSLILISRDRDKRESNEFILKKLKSYDSKLKSEYKEGKIQVLYQAIYFEAEDIGFIKQEYNNISKAIE